MFISSICQKFLKTSLELYGWQFDMEEITALFDNYYFRAFKQLHWDTINCKIKRLQCNTLLGKAHTLNP